MYHFFSGRMLLFYYFAFVWVVVQSEEDLIIGTTSGLLNGIKTEMLGKSLNIFYGVPYAVPPVGELRFKPPVAFEARDSERDAKSFAPMCIQPQHATEVLSPLLKPNRAEMSEDCLYLNIYAPGDVQELENLPVMVWLAGEGFNYADPLQFDGSYLSVEGRVIVVTVNYRVSVFGFLSGLHDEAPGNVGLLDQRLALRWVKENIASFGGDQNRITLFGRFSGAMSAAIHAFSSLSKEEALFERIILQSGVPAGEWIFDKSPMNATLSLAQATDCERDTISKIIACFKRLSAEELLRSGLAISHSWRPTLDFSLISEETLKAAASKNYRRVDIMIGLNSNEGTLCLTALKALKSNLYEDIINRNLKREAFNSLISNSLIDVFKQPKHVVEKLTQFSYSDSDEARLRDQLIEFCGDLYITGHSEKLAEIISNMDQSVFIYELRHRPSFSNQPAFVEAGHGDDVLYSFGLPLSLRDLPEEETILTRDIISTITNFARYGNPNTENSTAWPAYKSDTRLYRIFNAKHSKDVQKSAHDAAVTFWHDIIPEVQHPSCPLPPVASALFSQNPESMNNPTFFGHTLTIPTAEYIMFSLVCASGILFIISVVSVVSMLRIKHHATFHRLK